VLARAQMLLPVVLLCSCQGPPASVVPAVPPPEADGVRDVRRLPVTRDTWVSAFPGEEEANLGGERRIKLKGIQELALLDVDPLALGDRVVVEVGLHLRCLSNDCLRRTTVSSLGSDWEEGTGRGYRPLDGAASFRWARRGLEPWAYPGSDLTSVIAGQGGSWWGTADPSPPDADGWQVLPVLPETMAARRAGLSHGFAVIDDVGSEYERKGESIELRPFPNRWFAAREAGERDAPFFAVRLGEIDRHPPGPVTALAQEVSAVPPPGEATVSWTTPSDNGPAGVLGFEVRYSPGPELDWERARVVPRYAIPRPGAVGDTVRLRWRQSGLPPGSLVTVGVRAVDGVGHRGPLRTTAVRTGAPIEPLPALPEIARRTAAVAPPRLGGLEVRVVDELDKVDPVTGRLSDGAELGSRESDHLWDAARSTVTLMAAGDEAAAFQVVLSGRPVSGWPHVEVDFEEALPSLGARVFAAVPIRGSDGRPVLDPLVPLAALGRGAHASVAASGRHRSLFVELLVPREARPGLHRGRLLLTSAAARLELGLELRVHDFAIPRRLSFVPQLNAYQLPPPPLEAAYYRLAHEHRTCLNRLPYGWRGQVLPVYEGIVTEGRWDWRGFDERFGPLLDGSAFSDLPRGAVPLEVFYLPLNENWPMSIDRGFLGGYWAEKALTAPYRRDLVEAARRFSEHVGEQGWTSTRFEFYLNNKVRYKQKRNSWDGSSAPWDFDEPVNTQDFWALRWYGEAFLEGVRAAGSPASMVFRADVSRPQWQRDLLDEVLGSWVIGRGSLAAYERLVADRRQRMHATVHSYGAANRLESPNSAVVGWCLEAWRQELDGLLVWQSIGSDRSWDRGSRLALLYPGGPVGVEMPLPSLRLKALRRGQQDVEYLALLEERLELAPWQLRRMVVELLPSLSVSGGGLEDPPEPTPVDLWRLRRWAASQLEEESGR